MSKKLPAYPQFVWPTIDPQLQTLQNNTLLPEITKFASGAYDFQGFPQISNILSQRNKQGLDELQRALLGAQAAQGQSGGLALKQLGQRLSDYQLADQDRQAQMGYNIYQGDLANRQYGLNAGSNAYNQGQNYAVNLANMRNQFENNAWNANVQNTLYRRATANTFENIGLPILAGLGGELTQGLTDLGTAKMYANALAGQGASTSTPWGAQSLQSSMPMSIRYPGVAKSGPNSGLSSLASIFALMGGF